MFSLVQLGFFLGALVWMRYPRVLSSLSKLSSFSPREACVKGASFAFRLKEAWKAAGEGDQERAGFFPVDSPDGLQHAGEIRYSGNSGAKEKIWIPFKRQHVSRMIPFTVRLTWAGGEADITQRPGLPYLATAAQLGGEKIVVESAESGDSVTFDRDEVPGYIEGLE